MSVWGPGLYQSDVTADLKPFFAELVRLPYDAGRLIEIATASFEASQPDDDACAAFWLAATDQLWTYGIEHAPTFARAQDLIRSGADLVAMRGLGMAEKDLARRAKALSDLSAKWAAPNPKPRGRKMMTEPEPFVFDEGAVVRYPTSAYAPINPYFPAKMIADWTQDGWGAFIVLPAFPAAGIFRGVADRVSVAAPDWFVAGSMGSPHAMQSSFWNW